MQALCDTVAARGAILLHHDLTREGTIAESVGIDPEALRLYGSHYHAGDPWACAPRNKELLQPGRAIPDHWLIPRAELKRTEHYTDFAEPFDLSRIVSLSLFRDRSHSGLSLLRAERDREFGTAELRFLETIIPHLQRAL